MKTTHVYHVVTTKMKSKKTKAKHLTPPVYAETVMTMSLKSLMFVRKDDIVRRMLTLRLGCVFIGLCTTYEVVPAEKVVFTHLAKKTILGKYSDHPRANDMYVVLRKKYRLRDRYSILARVKPESDTYRVFGVSKNAFEIR